MSGMIPFHSRAFAYGKRQVFIPLMVCALLAGAWTAIAKVMSPPSATKNMTLSSIALKDGGPISGDYTCDGKNISPPLSWTGVPENTQSLVLIVDDPDAPGGVWTHWILFNLPADTLNLAEDFGKSPAAHTAKQGRNDFKQIGYSGPCPPAGTKHRYYFKIFALDTTLNLPPDTTRKDIDAAMAKHVLSAGQLMGTYQRK
jgi:Raf kinase inhibitor-like YbhB/YbcL family protein